MNMGHNFVAIEIYDTAHYVDVFCAYMEAHWRWVKALHAACIWAANNQATLSECHISLANGQSVQINYQLRNS